MATEEAGDCLVCSKKTTLRCSKCKDAFFCNTSHQRLAFPVHKVFCAAGGAFVMPPFSKDEVLVLNGVRGERTMCPRAWKVESLLEKAKRHRLCPPEQKWETLLIELQRRRTECAVEEPYRSAILTMFRHRLQSDVDLPPGVPWLPLTIWQYATVGLAPFVMESFAPYFAKERDPTLWTRASECMKQDVLVCALTMAWQERGEGSTDLIRLGYDREIKLFEQLDVSPGFRQQQLTFLRNSQGCSTSDGSCVCPHHKPSVRVGAGVGGPSPCATQ